MQCDMCGKDTELVIALIEGTELKVCPSCGRFGKMLRRAPKIVPQEKKPVEAKPKLPEKELIEVIVDDCARLVKEAREKKGLTQEDFAKSINEKEAIIHKIESEKIKPNLLLAKKLERSLGIKLIESHEEVHGPQARQSNDFFTIGDMIKIKK